MKAIGLFLAFSIALEASPSYSVIDLGTLGGSSAIGFKINDSGTVVGWSQTIYGYPQAFQSINGAPLQALAPLAVSNSFALGINGAGQVAGTSYLNGQPHGVIWNGSGLTDLGADMYVTGINDFGAVIGGNGHAFLLVGGVYQDLGLLPGGDWSSASGINASGAVVGDANTTGGYFRGFVWSPKTGMLQLGTLGGPNSHATGINRSGQVIGSASLGGGYEHAFSAQSAILTDLGTLGGNSFAYGINDSGVIVGYSWPSHGDNPHAFVFLDGVMIDLNALVPPASGWELLGAYGINNAGQIVGEGLWNGQKHAFLLNPSRTAFSGALTSIPEPGGASLALIGLILVIIWKRSARALPGLRRW